MSKISDYGTETANFKQKQSESKDQLISEGNFCVINSSKKQT